MQKAHKPVLTCEIIRFQPRRIMPSMGIHVNYRLILARNNRCTNPRSISTRSGWYGEFKNVNTGFVHKAHKPVRTCEIIRFQPRRIMPSMEIHENYRLILARNNRCTNPRSISTRSEGYGEFKNVNTGFVEKAHKSVRTCEIIHFKPRRIMPRMEIHANSRLILARKNR